jgi:filamentous hemagglutinin
LQPYAYAGGDPINRADASGQVWDTIADVAFIVMDAGFIAYENIYQGRTDTLAVNVGALALDVGCAFVPLATGGGVGLRGGAKAAQVESKVARAEPHVAEAVQYLYAGTKRTSQAAAQGQRLREGQVGRYGELTRPRTPGDDLTPHHMPPDAYMAKKVEGYRRTDGVAMMMEQPPTGGRHRQTASYGRPPDFGLSPRSALAQSVWDVRAIYVREGKYTAEIRFGLQETIRENKVAWPGAF